MGTVYFNLAENRDNPEQPFAFLATYALATETAGKPQHIPLARVMKDAVQNGKRETLLKILTPLGEAAKECPWLRELVESRRIFQPQSWTPQEAYRLLQDIPRCEAAGLSVRVPDWWGSGKRTRPQVKVELGKGAPSRVGAYGLVDFKLSVAVGDDVLTDAEWETLLTHADGLVKMRGRWIEVDSARLALVQKAWRRALAMTQDGGIPFGAAMRFLVGTRPREVSSETSDTREEGALSSDDFGRWSEVTAGPWLEQALLGLRQPEILQSAENEPGIKAQLRPYQAVGVNWLWHIYGLQLGGCLADDMGLGKTLQILALLTRVKRVVKPMRPSLLIVPASLLGNWCAEAQRFAPTLKCHVVHNAFPEGTKAYADHEPPDVILTSYGLLTRLPWLLAKSWEIVILDEAQAIKNPTTQQALYVKKVQANCRIALTGTPVENRVADLWSLFDFVCPQLLGSMADFRALTSEVSTDDSSPETSDPLQIIRKLVSPYILRRLKTDKKIISDLPPKTEMTVWCGLAPRQAALYAAEVSQLKRDLEELDTARSALQSADITPQREAEDDKIERRRRGLILGYLTRFKQICNHPAQAMGIGQFTRSDSGKLQRLCALAEEICDNGEKLLVFTQFQAITNMLAAHLADIFGRDGLVLTGATPVKERKRLVDDFQRSDGPPFFILSLKAGGTGLNLTAASHVIHFDRWWNPAVENQATDRAFRIGQKKPVLVHKFVCQGTIEEKVARMIADKTAIASQILSSPKDGTAVNLTELTDAALLDLVALDIKSANLVVDS